jgi:hypothetical protein
MLRESAEMSSRGYFTGGKKVGNCREKRPAPKLMAGNCNKVNRCFNRFALRPRAIRLLNWSQVASATKTVLEKPSTLPGGLSNDGAHLLDNLISAAVGTFDFFGFTLSYAHDDGKFFTAFLAEKFVSRHNLGPLSEGYWHQHFSKLNCCV